MKLLIVLMLCSLPAFPQCASATRFWVGGGSSNTWVATGPTNWATTSGGSNNAAVPTTTDLVCFDANSGTSTSTISANIIISTYDLTNYAGTMALGTAQLKWTGSKAISGVNVIWTFTTGQLNYTGTGSSTLSLLGPTLPTIVINGTGTVTLGASIGGCLQLQLSEGTFTANTYNVTCATVVVSNTSTKVLNMGTGTWTLTGTGGVWSFNATSNLTVNPSTATITITDVSASQKQFADGFATSYANNIINLPGGTGGVYFNPGANETFGTINATPGGKILFQSGFTATITTPNFSGTSGNLVTIGSNTSSAATISVASGAVCWSYVSFPSGTTPYSYITAAGGAVFYAQNSTHTSSNVTGITFSACPTGAPPGITMFGPARLASTVVLQ